MDKHELLYDNDLHQYTLDGKIVPSVTELAKKFSGMDTTWLEQHPEYAERGTEAHNELADYFVPGSTMALEDLKSDAAKEMSQWLVREDTFQNEVLVYNTKYGYAGTVDLINIVDGKCKMIVDWKTGTHNNKLYCRCQLSLYYLALKEMGVDVSETGMCIITPEGPIYFEPFSWTEMQGLLADFAPTGDVAKEIAELENKMNELVSFVAEYDDCKERLKELLSKGFEDTQTRRFNGEHFSFTYVPATKRKSLDQTKVAAELGDLEPYMKESTVSASVRIKEI